MLGVGVVAVLVVIVCCCCSDGVGGDSDLIVMEFFGVVVAGEFSWIHQLFHLRLTIVSYLFPIFVALHPHCLLILLDL